MLSKLKSFCSSFIRPRKRTLVIGILPIQKKWRQLAALGTGMSLVAWINHEYGKGDVFILKNFQAFCASPQDFLQQHVWENTKDNFKMMTAADIESFLRSRFVWGKPTNTMLFTDEVMMNAQIDVFGLEELDGPIYPAYDPVSPSRGRKLYWLPEPIDAVQIRAAHLKHWPVDKEFHIGENVHAMVAVYSIENPRVPGWFRFRPFHMHGISVIKYTQKLREESNIKNLHGNIQYNWKYYFATDKDMVEILQRNHEEMIYHIPPV